LWRWAEMARRRNFWNMSIPKVKSLKAQGDRFFDAPVGFRLSIVLPSVTPISP
jgi:hypothetical protein